MVRSCCGSDKHVGGAALLDDHAAVHEHEVVADLAREAHLVGHDHHRHALGGEVLHHREHVPDELGVERAGGLVEEHHVGIHRQRPRDRDPLLLPAGQVRRVGVDLLRQADLLEVPAGDRDGLVLAAALDPLLRDREVAQHGQVREQVERLEHHPDAGPDLVDVDVRVGDLDALDEDLPRRRGLEQVHAAQQRGLAGAGGPDDADHLAVVDVEVDALEHLVGAEVLVQLLHVDGGCGLVDPWLGHQRALSERASMRRTTIDSGMVISR